MAWQQQQLAEQNRQREEAYRQQQLHSLEEYRKGTLGLGQQKVQTQQNIADQRTAAQTQNNQYSNDTRYAIAQMRDDQVQQSLGLRKEQVMGNLDYHDRQLQQGDQKMQQLDQWHDAQLQAGANRLQVEQQYHQELVRLRQAEDATRGSRAADESRLGVIKQRLSQLDTDNPKDEASKARKQAERSQLYTESEAIQARMRGAATQPTTGAVAAPATIPQPYRPQTQSAPSQPSGQQSSSTSTSRLVNNVIQDFRDAYEGAKIKSSEALRVVEAIDALRAKGYTHAPDGTPLEVTRQKAMEFYSVENVVKSRQELTTEQLVKLVQAMGDPQKAKEYLASQGYDSAGRPSGGR